MPWGRRKKEEGENKVGKTGRGVSGKFQADLIIHKGSSLQVVVCCCVFDFADLLYIRWSSWHRPEGNYVSPKASTGDLSLYDFWFLNPSSSSHVAVW